MTYPNLERAVIFMARDNGCINRYMSEEMVLDQTRRWLESHSRKYPPERVAEVEEWLLTLTENQLQTVLVGERFDALDIMTMMAAPVIADSLLNAIFEVL